MVRRNEKATKDQLNTERRRNEIADMQQAGDWDRIYLCLVMFAEHMGYSVRETQMIWFDGIISGSHIGIRSTLKTAEERARNLAHELGHAYLSKGQPARDLIADPDPKEERRADEVGKAMIDFARFSIEHGAGIPDMKGVQER